MTALRMTLAATALGAGAVVVPATAAPAQADLFAHDEVNHYSPDGGFDGPIKVRCGGVKHFVYEGQSSSSKCDDVDDVYLGDEQVIKCRKQNAEGDGYWYVWLGGEADEGWNNGIMSSGLVSKRCVIGYGG